MTAGLDGTVRLWDPATGHALGMLVSDEDRWAVIAADGRFDAEGNPDDLVLWWFDGSFSSITSLGECYRHPGLLSELLGAPR